MSAPAAQIGRRWWSVEDLLVLLLLGALFYLPGLGQVCLFDRDEPRFAAAAHEMLQTGAYAVPHFNGALRPDKPPLIYWLMTAAYRALGVNEFAARLPSAVAGTLTLMVVYFAAGRRFGRVTAMIAALMLGSAALFVAESRLATADAVMVFFITAALALAWEAWDGAGGFWLTLGFWTALALGVLTKGVPLIFVLLPLLVLPLATGPASLQWQAWSRLTWAQRLVHLPELVTRLIARGNWRFWCGLQPAWGVLIPVALVGVWVGAVWASPEGPDLLAQMLGRHVRDRALKPAEGHWGPPGFYLLSVWATFWPWSVLLVPMAFHVWRRLRGRTVLAIDPHPYQFLLAWLVPSWLVYECIATKLVHYVLPLWIPLAILCADTLVQSWARLTEVLAARWFAWVRWLWGGIWLALAGAVLAAAYLLLDRELLGAAWLLAGALAATGVAGTAVWGLRSWPYVTVLGFGATLALANALVLPQVRELRLSQLAAAELLTLSEQGYAVGAAGYQEPSLVFYWEAGRARGDGRDVPRAQKPEEKLPLFGEAAAWRRFAAGLQPTALVVDGAGLAKLEATPGVRARVLRVFRGWPEKAALRRYFLNWWRGLPPEALPRSEVTVVTNQEIMPKAAPESAPAAGTPSTPVRELFEGRGGSK